MEYMRICLCKSCKALDYATNKCPRCGGEDITEVNSDFLLFENMSGLGRRVRNIAYDLSIQNEK